MRDLPAIGAKVPPSRGERAVDAARAVFSRGLAALLTVAAFVVWARIAGVAFAGPSFDGATVPTRAVLVVFAALLPAAALGLWQVQSWGRVLWLAAVALHVVAIANAWWPTPSFVLALAFHAATVGLFLAIELAGLLARRRTR